MHVLLLICVVGILIVLCTFFFQSQVDNISENDGWISLFSVKEDINLADISHDEEMWYYKGKSTCVGFGEIDQNCKRNECYCSGKGTYGSPKKQVKMVIKAIENDGLHPMCPLLY